MRTVCTGHANTDIGGPDTVSGQKPVAAEHLKGNGVDLAVKAVVLVEEHTGSSELEELIELRECEGLPVCAVDEFRGSEQLYVGLTRAGSYATPVEHRPVGRADHHVP